MTPGIIKKLYHTTPVGLTDEDKQEVYPITATSAVYSAPGESSFPNMSLDNILDALNQGYQYMGKATPTTNPGVYNHKVFYLASDPGTYSYFGNIEVSSLTVLKTSGNSWTADVFNITGGGGGGTAAGYIGTTLVQSSPAPQNLGGISQLNLTSGARIYFGETAYIELDQYGFHFSQGIYSDSFVAAGGIGSPGGGGGGSYSAGNGISLANDIISVRIGTGLAFDSNGNLTATGGGSYILPIASASTLGGVKIGSGLSIDSEGVLSATGGGSGGGGTVTSVTLTQGNGISITNSGVAITTSGSRTISIASATLTKIENGNTAYGWGNHANAGYAMATDLAALATRVTNIEDWFEIVTVSGQEALHAKNSRAIYSDSWIAAGGINSSGGSGGGSYTPGNGISIVNDEISVKIGTGLAFDANGNLTATGGGGGDGTVTSVALTVPSQFEVSGSPITTSGTLAISLKSSYTIPPSQDWTSLYTAAHTHSNYNILESITADKIAQWDAGGVVDDVTLGGTSVVSNGVAVLPAYPTTLPASDVYSWAKESSKPSYSLSEISGTQNLRAIEALTGNGLLRRTGTYTWEMDSTAYLSSHQTIYKLTLNAGSFVAGEYTPNSEAKTFNIPTNLDHIADGTSRKLSDYVTLSTTQTITGAKTFSDNPLTIASSSGISVNGSSYIDIGDARIVYDATNNAIHITRKNSGTAIGLYADGALAAGGIT